MNARAKETHSRGPLASPAICGANAVGTARVQDGTSLNRYQDKGAPMPVGEAIGNASDLVLPTTTNSDMPHHVYILECADGTYYTGYTTDVERRVAEHNEGTGAKYTRGRTPVEVIHTETYDSQSAAMQREYAIKQLRRPAKEELVDVS